MRGRSAAGERGGRKGSEVSGGRARWRRAREVGDGAARSPDAEQESAPWRKAVCGRARWPEGERGRRRGSEVARRRARSAVGSERGGRQASEIGVLGARWAAGGPGRRTRTAQDGAGRWWAAEVAMRGRLGGFERGGAGRGEAGRGWGRGSGSGDGRGQEQGWERARGGESEVGRGCRRAREDAVEWTIAYEGPRAGGAAVGDERGGEQESEIAGRWPFATAAQAGRRALKLGARSGTRVGRAVRSSQRKSGEDRSRGDLEDSEADP